MQITVIAVLCHQLVGITGSVCREEIVIKDDMPMQACMLSQPALAEWKAHSIYRSPDWTVRGYRCAIGDRQPKDAT